MARSKATGPVTSEHGRKLVTYTAKYTRLKRGYMGQLVEWPEVITEGRSLDDCRESLKDALREMILAYRQLGKEIPDDEALFERIALEA